MYVAVVGVVGAGVVGGVVAVDVVDAVSAGNGDVEYGTHDDGVAVCV